MDFLGKNEKILPYEELEALVKSLGINSKREYVDLFKSNKLPQGAQLCPDVFYKGKGWKSWWDFLGKGTTSKTGSGKFFLSYEEAKKFVQSIGITYIMNGRNTLNQKMPIKIFLNIHTKPIKEMVGQIGMIS